MEDKRNIKRAEGANNLIIESRRRLTVSGVDDVDSFDESAVTLLTQMGTLSIRGAQLHINRLSIETGEISIEGSIDSLEYSDISDNTHSGGFISKLFR